jgi:hypothetical protein
VGPAHKAVADHADIQGLRHNVVGSRFVVGGELGNC